MNYIQEFLQALEVTKADFIESNKNKSLSQTDYLLNLMFRYEILSRSDNHAIALDALKNYERILTILMQSVPEPKQEPKDKK